MKEKTKMNSFSRFITLRKTFFQGDFMQTKSFNVSNFLSIDG